MKPLARGVAWLSTKQAAEHLGFPSVAAFHKFIQEDRKRAKPRLRVHWLGPRMRFRVADLDACVESEPQAVEVRPGVFRTTGSVSVFARPLTLR